MTAHEISVHVRAEIIEPRMHGARLAAARVLLRWVVWLAQPGRIHLTVGGTDDD